jgi:hypothetical protein
MDDHNADEVPRTGDYDERSERRSSEAFDESSTDFRQITAAQTKYTAGCHLLPMSISVRALLCVTDALTYPGKALLEGTGSLKGMPWIKESQKVLRQSSCRICRFLAWIIKEESLQDEPYGIHRHNRENEVDQSLLLRDREVYISLITFLQRRQGYSSSPHFMLTNSTPDDGEFERRCHYSQEIDAGQIRDWVEQCETNHRIACVMDSATQTALRELRVVDCERRIVVRAPPGCRYTALSYVWGPPSNTCESLQEPPKTIAQSILFTQKLGYRYLWVDRFVSLCYPQMVFALLTMIVHQSR